MKNPSISLASCVQALLVAFRLGSVGLALYNKVGAGGTRRRWDLRVGWPAAAAAAALASTRPVFPTVFPTVWDSCLQACTCGVLYLLLSGMQRCWICSA